MKRTLALGAVLLLLAIAGAAAWIRYSIERPYQGFAAEGVFVDLPHGASSRTVARLLKQNGVIRSAFTFEVYARRHPRRRLQAGEYFFNRAISGHDVFWQIADGHIYEQPFTVREGETIFDIAHDLEAEKLMTADEFLAAAQNPELIRDIAPHAKTLEGFLFPATYFLPRHPTPTDVTAEMVHKFKVEWQRIAPTESQRDTTGLEHGRPVASVVTLASLVERETPKPEERPLVAGAFENRLRKNIPLQCDPTVIYAMQDAGQYNGKLIGVRAALDPAKTDYLYFVANTQGGHFFAATLVEHNRNVTKYRRLLAGLPADPPAPPPALPAAHKQATKAPRKRAATKKSPGKHKAHPKQQQVASQ